MDLNLRWCVAGDLPALLEADGRAFGFHYEPGAEHDKLLLHDPGDFLVAEHEGRIVGITDSFPFDMTVPGGASVGVRGVSWVSVQATHRRRGVLTALMREQHARFVGEGHTAAVLTASEGGIYGRFGYGPASRLRKVQVDRRLARLRPGVAGGDGVRMVSAQEARSLLPERYERWRRLTPGGLSRGEAWWTYWFLDKPMSGSTHEKRFYAVHPDGYVTYRVAQEWTDGLPASAVTVDDLFAATDAAHAELWGFLLGLDLMATVSCFDAPLDDPLPFLLDDPRSARTTVLRDGLWVRLLDVPAALAARTYAVDGTLVLDVDDPFLGRGGRVRLEGGPMGATCTPTDAPADLALGIGALGAVYLGAHRPSTLARAGLVHEAVPGALARADAMFAAEREAHFGTSF